ncbi:MAG: biotin transporter BioY [Bacillales bacterium]|jgi:biotin transport system substrate-specific component|nr:biotin transporter BioY [Bacillales bacterium]
MKNFKTFDLVICSLFAALSGVLSQIAVPIGAVPINLTHISIFVAAGLLGAKRGFISQFIFVLLGAIGLPVFSKFSGGLGVLVGPTGGFIVGYLACAFITGFMIDRFGRSIKNLFIAMLVGIVVTYVLGISWFMYATKLDLVKSLTICVYPFLLGDFLKIVLSTILVNRLYPLLKKKLG